MENDPGKIIASAQLAFRNSVLPLFGINEERVGTVSTLTASGVMIEHVVSTEDKYGRKVTYIITGSYDNEGNLVSLKQKKSTELSAGKLKEFEIEASPEAFRINFPACDENSDLTFSFDSNCPSSLTYKFCEGKSISCDNNSGLIATKSDGSKLTNLECTCFNGKFYEMIKGIYSILCPEYIRKRIFDDGPLIPPLGVVISKIIENDQFVSSLGMHIKNNLLNPEESFEQAFLPLLPRDAAEAFSVLSPKIKTQQLSLEEMLKGAGSNNN